MIKLKINEKPILKHCEMNCDKPLHHKLDDYDLTKFLNKHSTSVFIGRPGSDKSSILNSLFSSLFTKVYHKIYLFIPENSRVSVKKSPFDNIPENQQYNKLTLENLNNVITEIKEADKKFNIRRLIYLMIWHLT
jgi:predicted GTPase